MGRRIVVSDPGWLRSFMLEIVPVPQFGASATKSTFPVFHSSMCKNLLVNALERKKRRIRDKVLHISALGLFFFFFP